MTNKKSIFIIAIITCSTLAFLSLFYFLLKKGNPNLLPSALIGKAVPNFESVALPPYPTFTQADLTSGKVIILNFWASWCPTCRDEHPLLKELAAAGIIVYGIDRKDAPENARQFLKTYGNPYKAIITDASGRIGIDWGVYGMPETFLISKDGKIIKRYVGELNATSVEEIKQLAR